tara:strand:+ start:48 stop:2282 length:2235 start_codon:yes stop_codon:yes gene_type:complete
MGGVAGHMAHLSEDLDLTFNEIVSILTKVASGEIKNATEKVDGQNLFLSWTVDANGEVRIAPEGEARTARNRGDIIKGGMTTDEYISKWKGHPAENAFTNGFKAVSAALRKLSPETLEDIFSNGQRYVNMEIMYPKNPNIILYSAPNIVLHGLQYFGDDETSDSRMLAKEKFRSLVKAIDGAVQEVGGENWNIYGPKIVALKKLADGSALEEVTSKIQSFASPVGMDAKLKDYVGSVVKEYTEQVDLPNNVAEQVLMLMLDPEEAKSRGITVVKAKKGLPKELQTVVSKLGSKTNSRKYISSVLRPLEIAISDFAIEVLRGVKSFFVDDHDKEVQRMRAELQQSIVYLKDLQSSGDEKMGELVDKQLAKLGKIENLASSLEGVVFEYPPGSDRIYKLTGAFAMANQIIGRARRSGMTEDLEDPEIELDFEQEPEVNLDIIDAAEADPQPAGAGTKPIALVPGAFKPPHQGHLKMVEQYANEASEVVVLISKPTKAGRKLPNGKEITAADSIRMWQVLAAHLPNVEIKISDHASPITATYEYIGKNGPLESGTEVILGVCTKGGDVERFREAANYVKEGVRLRPLEICAVDPVQHGPDYMELLENSPLKEEMPSVVKKKDPKAFHASDMRYLLGKAEKHEEALKLLEDFAGSPENVMEFLSILGIDTGLNEPTAEPAQPALEENSMGGGSIAGGGGVPLGSTSGEDKPGKRDKKKKKKKHKYFENIDLSLVDEVLELLIERGLAK